MHNGLFSNLSLTRLVIRARSIYSLNRRIGRRSNLCIWRRLPRIVGLLSQLMQLMRQTHGPIYQFTILISISQVVPVSIFCLITVCDLLRLQRSILSIFHDSDADTRAVTGREALSTATSRSELCVWCYVLGFSIDVVVSSQKATAFVISVCQQGAGHLEIIERRLIVGTTKVKLVWLLLAQRKEIFTVLTFLIICFFGQQRRPLP